MCLNTRIILSGSFTSDKAINLLECFSKDECAFDSYKRRTRNTVSVVSTGVLRVLGPSRGSNWGPDFMQAESRFC